ncbi:MAG: ribonuclease III [Clostridiales bacterium]|nr:ribonuclease III [Clostridiales bacterium]
MIFDLDGCQKKIGYVFKDTMLLRRCFTHASYSHENGGDDNELLEFFGDAIIEFVVTEYLYKNSFGDEGKLTEYRKDLVSKTPLQRAMERLDLSQYVLLGHGLNLSSSHDEKLYSSVYEALVAGIYIDGGLKPAKDFIYRTLIDDYELRLAKKKVKPKAGKDAKSLLQEFVQKLKLGSISYESMSRKGPDHMPEFREAVLLNGKRLAEGKGKSRKAAQTEAAERALEKLKKQGGN